MALLPAAVAAELDAAFDALSSDIDEGMGILQVWEDPPELTLRRRDTTTEAFATVATFIPIRIQLADRLEQASGQNAGMVQVVQGGELWIRGALTIRRDDRFSLNGVPCVVTLVKPATRVKQVVEFTYLGGV